MPERRPRSRELVAVRLPRSEEGIHCHPAEGHDDAYLREQANLPLEVRSAPPELRGGRPIPRRSAPHGGGDVGVPESESIVPRHGDRLTREARTVEGPIQPGSAAVSREDAARPIPTMGSRREPDDQHAGVRIPESGDRAAPVRPRAERSALRPGDGLAVSDEARAHAAGDDLRRQTRQPGGTWRGDGVPPGQRPYKTG